MMSESHGGIVGDEDCCEFTLHRDEIPTEARMESMGEVDTYLEFDENDFWRCGFEKADGYDRCIFHLEASKLPEDVNRSDRLRHLINGDPGSIREKRRRRKQLIGINLETLDLADEKISGPDNLPLDLRCSEIGKIICHNTRFEIPVDIRGSTIGDIHAANSTWSALHAQYATIESMAFDRARLREAYFEHVDGKRGRFYFSDLPYINYHHSTIDWLNFMYADIGEAGFFSVETDLVTFFGSSLTGGYFNDATFGYLNYEQVEGTECHFNEATVHGASFDGSNVDQAVFTDISANRIRMVGCDFDSANFDGSDMGVATLDELECTSLSLVDVAFYQSLSIEDAIIMKEIDVQPNRVIDGPVGYVSLRETSVPRGTLEQPPDEVVLYDLEKTTLGEVTVAGELEGRLMRNIRIANTNFDGFDFRSLDDVDLDEAKYDIHTLDPDAKRQLPVLRKMQESVGDVYPVIDDPENHSLDAAEIENRVDFRLVELPFASEDTNATLKSHAIEATKDGESSELLASASEMDDPRLLESTYQKAKNGAKLVGHSTAAGRFFELERKYRRHAHRARMLSRTSPLGITDRLMFATRWFRSGIMSVTTGYGERPWRAIGSSFAVILLFTGIYSLLQPPLAETPEPSVTDYLVFSLQSFVSFIVGTPPQTASLWIRVASALEGFFGAFFVALFVFTLTRTVHR